MLCDETKMKPIGTPFDTDSEAEGHWKIVLLFFVLALLIHLILFTFPFEWHRAAKAPPVEIQQIDPGKLDAIRKQWKEKSLLLNRDSSKPSEATPPKDARYSSDRNRTVEKEQRSRDTNVIPQAGRPNTDNLPENRTESKKHASSRTKIPLGSLGIPFKFDESPKDPSENPEKPEQVSQKTAGRGLQGGDQTILDKDLPQGSENILNTQESIYYSFYARLYEAVGPLWQSRTRETLYRRQVLPGEYITVVDIILDQYGNLRGIRRLQSSGISEFDQDVDETWRKIDHFPNPPQGLLDGERQIHMAWKFTVEVGRGMGGPNYLPPERQR